ncbi:hypothetical protein C3F09_04320 [candidate division GN15 bacterium]|uniref:Omptin family outer membrane protease n=1 Tax=candidate division GN15 bacterium TaxID=2072418 RepID=A0A855X9D7_9BACT|nr:MAG: hypothetical protein C3F09_04320 [candidate division GN15 bacterium]
MKKLLVLATFVCAAAVATAPAQEPTAVASTNTARPHSGINISISPFIQQGFGYTKWIMEVRGLIDSGIIGTVKSELDYPLNSVNGGLELRIGSGPSAYKDWSIALSVSTDLKDPTHVMKDYDWIFIPGGFNGGISYTESSVKMTSLQGSLQGQLTLARSGKSRFGMLAGVRYQHFDQKLYDLAGWQLDSANERFYFDVYQDTLVGTYKITYTMPNIGLFYRLQFNEGSSVELNGAFMVPFMSDEDDHVLRNRLATASSSGTGYFGEIKVRLSSSKTRGKRPFVELSGQLMGIDARPKQTIYWYGDDPITPEFNDTGSRLPGIPHHVISKQQFLTTKVGVMF